MIKEYMVSFMILSIVFVGNTITENYTKKSVDETSQYLNELKDELVNNEKKEESVNNKIERIHDIWDQKYEKLAFYIEHDELEKVETELTDIRAKIRVKEYDEANPEIDKCIFILEHIKEKNAFNLKNIF